jgi:dipeptidyl aminopeptidase/acylaminoacyl peptidase
MNVLCAALFATAVLSPEQTLDRRAIGELAFSPDGTRVVFTVTEPVQGATRARSIWVLDVATGRARQLTFSGKSDSSPRWSPDGRGIAFISDRDGTAQLYLLPIASAGEAEKLTDRKEAVSEFRWSPDGSRIALLMAEPKPPEQQARERMKNDSRRADKDERHARVWILDVTTHALAQLTSDPHRFTQVEWMPTGKTLVGIADATPGSDRWTEQIYTIDAATGTIVASVTPRGPFGGLTVGMDGNTIAYVGARVDGPEPHDLYAVRLKPDSQTNLTAAAIDRPIGQPRWIDARTIAAIVARGFRSTIALATLDGQVTDLETPVNPTSFARASDGTFVFAGETTTQPPELWIKRAGAPAKKATTLNEKWASMPVVSPEFIKYKSFDGKEIEAALLRPSSSQPQGQSPFVVLVHGGPTGRWSDTFEPWGQLLAQRGYAVLYPNIRGSVGYGETFVEANRADWGGGDFKDVMAAVDWAVAQRIADPARLGIGGWSYGGFMAAWAVTQTTRFKAAVSGAPVIDMASEFGTERGSSYDEWFYGTPYEQLDGFIKSSPMTYVKNVRTPTLLLQGEADETDPIGQSQQFYRGLKRYGVDTDLVLYPREGHGLREEPHLLDRLTRVLSWYDRHLKPAATPTSPAS